MTKWFSAFRRDATAAGATQASEATVLELCVVEGVDAGQQFTVDGAEVRIGRGVPQTAQAGAVLLHDTSVSAEQATIRTTSKGSMLEHNPRATNPTFVNGREVRTPRPLKPSDRIQMGRVVLEVRQRSGIGLAGFFAVTGSQPKLHAPEQPGEPTQLTTLVKQDSGNEDLTRVHEPSVEDALTVIRTLSIPTAYLTVISGVDAMEGERFEVIGAETVVGRSAQCDITIPEPGVSRRHCRLEWRDRDLVLVHMSATNASSVNGVSVAGEHPLSSGDEVLLADQVGLRVEFEVDWPPLDETTRPAGIAKPSLREQMEARVEQDRLIEEEFSIRGSFVDVDVVGSYGMKHKDERPANIIVSFERFRSYVERIIGEFGGQVLNSNGDELMCFFDSTEAAVRSASAILSRLEDFNTKENVLSSPFRFRIGVHTGTSLVDRARGVAYSPVLDIAGHLQKNAEINGLLISEATMQALPEGLPFEPAGPLPKEDIETYRLNGTL